MRGIRAVLLMFPLMLAVTSVLAQQGGIESLRETGKAFAAVARTVSPSVVFIEAEIERSAAARPQPRIPEQWPFGDDFFRRFFGDDFPGFPPREAPGGKQPAIGQGSGFVFAAEQGAPTNKTYVMTNNHVVENADKIRVTFQDGREFAAVVTGRDPSSDVAVIEIQAEGLPALRLGDSKALEVGEWVVAIGNPFGLSHTLTVGVVSAKGRTTLGINDYEDFIQTDAAINPGNSGGPLVNLDGEVVGMNTAIFTRSGGYMGVGFAIPVNLAKVIANQLIQTGEVTRGFLGIVVQVLTPALAESFGIAQTQGVLIAQVNDDSPAARAGLRQGDVIVAYRGRPVKDVGTFRNEVSLTSPGSREALTIIRDGEHQSLSVTIGRLVGAEPADQPSSRSAEDIGLTVQTLTRDLADQLGVKGDQGVVVVEVTRGSAAARAGVQADDIILQVDRKPVRTAAEFISAINAGRSKGRVLLLIRRGELQQYTILPL